MPRPPRKLAFVLASTDHGAMILSRLDFHTRENGFEYGVGIQMLNTGGFDVEEVAMLHRLLAYRRRFYGDGVIAVDCGANVGVHTVEWATAMTGWGEVIAIEAQERLYYALAGNIALANCFNARAIHAAAADKAGVLRMPVPDYLQPGSLGSFELRQREKPEFIGQPIDYGRTVEVQQIALDDFALPRLDLIKIDVEGMEIEVLEGARRLIETHRPMIVVEMLKIGEAALKGWLRPLGYRFIPAGPNIVAIHEGDQALTQIKLPPQ